MNDERRRELLGHTHLGRISLSGDEARFFDENKIKRASDGKFAPKSGASSGRKSADAVVEDSAAGNHPHEVARLNARVAELEKQLSDLIGKTKSTGSHPGVIRRVTSATMSSLSSVANAGVKTASKAAKAVGDVCAEAFDSLLSANDRHYASMEKKFGKVTAKAIQMTAVAGALGLAGVVATTNTAFALSLLPATMQGTTAKVLLGGFFSLGAAHVMLGPESKQIAYPIMRWPAKVVADIALGSAKRDDERGKKTFSKTSASRNSQDAFFDGEESTLTEEQIKSLAADYARYMQVTLVQNLLKHPDILDDVADELIASGAFKSREDMQAKVQKAIK